MLVAALPEFLQGEYQYAYQDNKANRECGEEHA